MIVEIAFSLLAVAGFGLVLWRAKLPAIAHKVIGSTMSGVGAMFDRELDDDAKEIAVRRAGVSLILASFNIALRFIIALAVAAAPILLGDFAGLVSSEAVFDLMLRLDYILIVSVVAIVVLEVVRRLRRPAVDAGGQASEHNYSDSDQFLHVFAFSSPAVLKASSKFEDALISKQPETMQPPVFVTSLARGGTTALLNALYDMPGMATHTYRDMPFLTAPIIWDRLAGGAGRAVERRKRAHGDGLEIDLDSPEAFEEVLWKMFWPEKYANGRIELWGPQDGRPEAEQFFRRHMEKIVRARRRDKAEPQEAAMRYCSKNNANIARLSYLPEAFPGCRIVVPIRRPESHAASLWRQHKNFSARQAEDEFVKRYMRDIGHFEFGLIHQPIRFPGFEAGRYDPGAPDYWLDYWVHAFREVLRRSGECILVTQDDLREKPEAAMSVLSERIGVSGGGLDFRSYFRSTPDQTSTGQYSPELYDEAAALYEELQARAILAGEA